MPNPSELARQEYDRGAPTADGEVGEKIVRENDLDRARRLGFDTIAAALDYVEDVKRGEL